MDRLTPLDAWFLHVEDGVDHMHMALVGVLEGPCPDHDAVLADVAGRLDRVPRYRQRVQWHRLGITAPVWVDDPHFDVADHVRRATVPAPGDDAALARRVGQLIERELDRTRPLWEIWVVDGLADGTWATVIKVHHSLTDGVGGSGLVAALLDLVPDPPPLPPSTWMPAPRPTGWRMVVEEPLRRAWSTVTTMHPGRPRPGQAIDTARDAVAGSLAYTRDLPPTRPTVLNGPLHPERGWWPASVPRADVEAVRQHHRVSLNDVALTVIAGGLRDLLVAHGEPVAARDVRSLVPVTLRQQDRDGVLHNRVGAMVADLPVGIPDPTARLCVVHQRLEALKGSGEIQLTASLVDLSTHLPWAPVSGTLRTVAGLLHVLVQRNVNTVTTNVPGPPAPLWWMGRQVLRAWPVVPIGESVRVGVAIFTYLDRVTFGVTTDRVAVPDGHLVVRGLERDLATLVAALPVRTP